MENLTFGTCPKCEKGEILNGTNIYTCTHVDKENNEVCNFTVWKNYSGVEIDPELLIEIIEAGENGILLSDLTNKEGKTYEAIVYYNKDQNKLFQKFEDKYLDDVECPSCQGKIYINSNGYFCENSKQDIPEDQKCNIKVFKTISNKSISDKVAINLLKGKKTSYMTGFTSLKGKDFGAKLFINDSTYKVEFDFSIGKCPKCKEGDIVESEKKYGCNRWKDGCNLTIWKFTSGANISISDVEDLLTKGVTSVKKMKTKDGKEFSAKLYFDPNKGEITQI